MMSRYATSLLLLLPLAGAAQTPPSLALPATSPLVEQLLAPNASGYRPEKSGASSAVLPIWSGSNGELLAVVALPSTWVNSSADAAATYHGPSTWQLAGTSANANGLRWQSGSGLYAQMDLSQYLPDITFANCGVTGCDAGRASAWSRPLVTGSLDFGWSPPDAGVDLSYGLSWLKSSASVLGVHDLSISPLSIAGLADSFPSYTLGDETSLYARGRWHFEQGPALDVSASYGRGRLTSLGLSSLPAIDLDQLSLSLGLDAGSLRGAIVGHVLSSDDPILAGKRWTTLDFGVSWRTPWSGEISVGAQNLWSAPLNSPRESDSQARTPYIQYRQDL